MKIERTFGLFGWVPLGLVAIALAWTGPAAAQTVVLGVCDDQSGAKAGKKIRQKVQRALRSESIMLIAPAKYMKAARQKKLDQRAYSSGAVAQIAPSLSLDGVITCAIKRDSGRYSFQFKLMGPDGKTRLAKSLRNRKPVLGRPGIKKVVKAFTAVLWGETPAPEPDALALGGDIDLVPLAPLVPVKADKDLADLAPVALVRPAKDKAKDKAKAKAKERAKAKAKAKARDRAKAKDMAKAKDKAKDKDTAKDKDADNVKSLPVAPIKLAVVKPDPATDMAGGAAPNDTAAGVGADYPADPDITQQAPDKRDENPKSVPEIWVAAGASLHLRAGLNPRYEAGPFPGFRVEGRGFLGSFLDMAVLEDLGLEFAYDRGFGLTYTSAFRPEAIEAYEQHWRLGLVYRLSFEDVLLGPALLFRVGYGGTENGVDQDYPDIVSAGYTHTDLTIDAHLWLVRPLLKAYLSIGWLAYVKPGQSLSGSGMGVTFGGGVALELMDQLHLSAGYEQRQVVFDDPLMGETSDRFQMIFVRAGWTYR